MTGLLEIIALIAPIVVLAVVSVALRCLWTRPSPDGTVSTTLARDAPSAAEPVEVEPMVGAGERRVA